VAKRIFDSWFNGYRKYTFNTEAPGAFHWWTAVSTIAGAMQRKVYIDQKTFDWVPNFYNCLVGQAGLVTKSTSLRMGEQLLRKLGKKIRFGSQSGSWQAMAKEIQDSKYQIQGGLMSCPISYFVSEFGTFFDPQNREQVDFFVDSWDAQKTGFTRSTISGGQVEIQCPCVNILAATTPTWIKENFTATMVGGGFASRLIFVRGHAKRKLIAYPGLEETDEDHLKLQEQLVSDLRQIGEMEGPMHLTPEAVEWGRDWYLGHYTKKRQLSGERFDGYYARKQTHMHKLAIILSAAEGSSMKVEVRHLSQANDQLLLVEKDLASVIDNVTSKQISTTHKREILSIIRGEGEIDREELYAQLFQMMSGPDFDKGLSDLIKARQITISPRGGKTLLTIKDTSPVVVPIKKKG